MSSKIIYDTEKAHIGLAGILDVTAIFSPFCKPKPLFFDKMKRVTYMSTSRNIRPEEVQALTETSAKNNQRKHVTGVLLHLGNVFFQVIEGPVEAIEELWPKIAADPRHEEVVVLKTELDAQHRLFGTWSMRAVDLNRLQEFNEKELNEVVLEPVRVLLKTVTESYSILEKYTQATIFKIMRSGYALTRPILLH